MPTASSSFAHHGCALAAAVTAALCAYRCNKHTAYQPAAPCYPHPPASQGRISTAKGPVQAGNSRRGIARCCRAVYACACRDRSAARLVRDVFHGVVPLARQLRLAHDVRVRAHARVGRLVAQREGVVAHGADHAVQAPPPGQAHRQRTSARMHRACYVSRQTCRRPKPCARPPHNDAAAPQRLRNCMPTHASTGTGHCVRSRSTAPSALS